MGLFRKKKKPETPKIKWHVPDGTEDFLVPKRGTPDAMAYDLVAPTDISIKPIADPNVGAPVLVNTLVAVTLPPGHAMILGSRSSMAAKKLITVEAGWIDNDYRGLIRVVLYNHGKETVNIKAGDRIAQARVVRVIELDEEVSWEYPSTDETVRGTGGFGSTGE